jgi:hypothetical protein
LPFLWNDWIYQVTTDRPTRSELCLWTAWVSLQGN